MCGSNSQQNQIEASQQQFYNTLTQYYKQTYGESQAILQSLTSAFEPILKAGIGQKGFTPEEEAALRASAVDTTGQQAKNLKQAIGDTLAAEGGGNEFLPSGVNAQIVGGAQTALAQQEAAEQQNITAQDYALGRQNFLEAAGILGGSTSVLNPATGMAGAATGAGSAASQTANEIAQANNSWMGILGGGLAGAGSALGGYLSNPNRG